MKLKPKIIGRASPSSTIFGFNKTVWC